MRCDDLVARFCLPNFRASRAFDFPKDEKNLGMTIMGEKSGVGFDKGMQERAWYEYI
jgi:hypothetical protein